MSENPNPEIRFIPADQVSQAQPKPEKEKIARLQIYIPQWLETVMREKAPIRRRGDLNRFFVRLLLEKFGDAQIPSVVPEHREETPATS